MCGIRFTNVAKLNKEKMFVDHANKENKQKKIIGRGN